MDDEMRDVIETEWPSRAAKLLQGLSLSQEKRPQPLKGASSWGPSVLNGKWGERAARDFRVASDWRRVCPGTDSKLAAATVDSVTRLPCPDDSHGDVLPRASTAGAWPTGGRPARSRTRCFVGA